MATLVEEKEVIFLTRNYFYIVTRLQLLAPFSVVAKLKRRVGSCDVALHCVTYAVLSKFE